MNTTLKTCVMYWDGTVWMVFGSWKSEETVSAVLAAFEKTGTKTKTDRVISVVGD